MRDSEVAQSVEVLAAKHGAPSLFPWICTPMSCPLVSTWVPLHAPARTDPALQ